MYFNGRKNIIVGLCVFSMIAPLGSGFASAYNATDSQKRHQRSKSMEHLKNLPHPYCRKKN